MSDRPRGTTGRRWWRLPVVLGLAAVACTEAEAQSAGDACRSVPPWRLRSPFYTVPSVAAWTGRELVVMGSPSFDTQDNRPFGPDGDSLMAGYAITREGRVRPIPMPSGSVELSQPRGLVRRGGRVDVLWGEPDSIWVFGAFTKPQRLVVGSYRDGRWQEVRTLSRHHAPNHLSRIAGSEIVRVRGIHHLVFPVEGPPGHPGMLGIASDSGGRWRVNTLELRSAAITAVAAVDFGGTLGVLFTAVPRVIEAPGGHGQVVWWATLGARGFSEPTQVGGDAGHAAMIPKLLPSDRGVIAAWRVLGTTPRIAWRRIDRSGAFGPIVERDGVAWMGQGEGPVGDVLAAVEDTYEARLLFLGPDGATEIRRIGTRQMLAPTITVLDGRPTAITLEANPDSTRPPIEWVAYDLSCDLRRARAAVAR